MSKSIFNINLTLEPSITFNENGFVIHSFLDTNSTQTDEELEATISYDEVINYNLESSLIHPNTEKEMLDPESFEGKAILEEIELLKIFIDKYEKRANKAIDRYLEDK